MQFINTYIIKIINNIIFILSRFIKLTTLFTHYPRCFYLFFRRYIPRCFYLFFRRYIPRYFYLFFPSEYPSVFLFVFPSEYPSVYPSMFLFVFSVGISLNVSICFFRRNIPLSIPRCFYLFFRRNIPRSIPRCFYLFFPSVYLAIR